MIETSEPPGQRSRGGRFGLSLLRHGEFRALWLSVLLSGTAYLGETVILGWLLLNLTDSAFIVGLGVALRALPNFLLGVPGGALVNRFDRRLVLRLVGLTSGINAATLGAVALLGHLTVGQILLVTFLGGALRALGQTARQSYAFDIAGPGRVVGSMSLMALGQRLGGVVGSLTAGFALVQWGSGEAYLLIALCHILAGGVMLFAATRGQSAPVERPPVWQGIRQYVEELGSNSNLRVLVLLTAAVEVLGFSHQAVMPSLARDLLDVGAQGLGLLSAVASFGGIIAVVALSFWGEVKSKGKLFLAVLLLFGASLILLASSSTLALALVAVAMVSGLASLTDLLSQTLVQSAVANDLRGRAMGSWILAIGLGPVGHLQIGALAALAGVTLALATNGVLLMALAGAVMLTARQIRKL